MNRFALLLATGLAAMTGCSADPSPAGPSGGEGGSGGGGPGGTGISPEEVSIGPGERQRFFAPSAGGGSWSASCGSFESEGAESAIWRAPSEPTSCTIDYSGGHGASVEVEPAEPTVRGFEGVAGWTEAPSQLVAGVEGSLWTLAHGGVVRFSPEAATWTLGSDLPLLEGRRELLPGPAEEVHLLAEVEGRLEHFIFGRGSDSWEQMPTPPEPHEMAWRGAAVASDGRICFGALEADGSHVVHCATEGDWRREAVAPNNEEVRAVGFTATDDLLFFTNFGRIYELREGEPEQTFESLYDISTFLVDGDDSYAFGNGVLRRSSQGHTWFDIGDGLPRGCEDPLTRCWLSGLALLDGVPWSIGKEGLYQRGVGSGVFVHRADLPPHEGDDFQGELLLLDGELVVGTSQGLWRYLPDDADWELISAGGAGVGSEPLAVDLAVDGTRAYSVLDEAEGRGRVFRQGPEIGRWSELRNEGPLPAGHEVAAVALRDDGTLLFGTERRSDGEGDRGLLYRAAPDGATYEPLSLEGLPAWDDALLALGWLEDDAALVALAEQGLFRLPAGSSEWEPLGPAAEVDAFLLHDDGRILRASGSQVYALTSDFSEWELRYEAPLSASIFHLGEGAGGELWLATSAGVFVADGEGLVSAGSGECSVVAEAIFARAGRAFCQAEDGRVFELSERRWIPLPGGPELSLLNIGPEGSLYLRLGRAPNAALVRTLP